MNPITKLLLNIKILKVHLKQVNNQFPTDEEIRVSLRRLGLKDVVFSTLKNS